MAERHVSSFVRADDAPADDGAPRKVVGQRTRPNLLDPTADTRAAAIAWRRAFPTPFVPKGVYRFSSHEEAQQWLMAMLTRDR